MMLWIGGRSYAIYLIHIPAFFLTREIWFRISPQESYDTSSFIPYILTSTALIITLSEANFRLVESPLRKKGAEIALRFKNSSNLTAEKAELNSAAGKDI